jgi:glycosyltransferase involved in cell wall biosynthesis
MLKRLSTFANVWNPDWDDRDSLRSLNEFGLKVPQYSNQICAISRRPNNHFGLALYEAVDREFRRGVQGPSNEFEGILGTLNKLLEDEHFAPEFWEAVRADARRLTQRRFQEGRARSVWGVTPIMGLQEMAAADRLCGIAAETVVFNTYYVTSNFDINFSVHQQAVLEEHDNWYGTFRDTCLIWALLRFDIFNLYSDRGFIEPAGGYGSDRFGIALREMDHYQNSGKRFYPYVYGADIRTRKRTLAQDKYNFCMDCPEVGRFCICDDEGAALVREQIAARATYPIAAHLSMDYVPGARNMYSLIVDAARITPRRALPQSSSTFRIGHFPNHGMFKGTEYLKSAVENLQKCGSDIELVLLSGLPNEEILEAMAGLDVLVDQLISGSFGLTAVEGMATGVPVICNVRQNVDVLESRKIPTIQADPDTIEEVLRGLIDADKPDLRRIGLAGRAYVIRNYSIVPFAGRLASLYSETANLPQRMRERLQSRESDIAAAANALSTDLERGVATEENVYSEAGNANPIGRWEQLRRLWSARREVARVFLRQAPRATRSVGWRVRSLLARGKMFLNASAVRTLLRTNQFLVSVRSRALRVGESLSGVFQLAGADLTQTKGGVHSALTRLQLRVASTLSAVNERAKAVPINARSQAIKARSAARKHADSVRTHLAKYEEDTLVSLAHRGTERRLRTGRVRTLWGITPILTLPLLAQCDRLLGLQSKSVVFTTYYITNAFDVNLKRLDQLFLKATRGRWPLNIYFFRALVFRYFLLRYDVFHYFYDRGILLSNTRFGISIDELELLRRSGKRVYTYAYGADVRSREATLSLGEPNLCQECPSPGQLCICNTEELDSSMQRLEGRVTQKIAMGDMLAYVPDHRNMHYWPIDAEKFQEKPLPSLKGEPFRIAHAPNHPHFKGTRFLQAAVARLQEEGHDIELIMIQGVPNERVIELFESCHIIADQFVAGFHGYTALEAMALGRPVLCFLRGPDMAIDPETCPIINATPETLYSVLKSCVTGHVDLERVGISSRAYVERYYTLPAIAAQLGHLYCETASFPEHLRSKISDRVTELEVALERSEFLLSPSQAFKSDKV